MGKARTLVCALALVLGQGLAADEVVIHGMDLTTSYPQFTQKISEIWQFASQDIANLGPGSTLAPEIYLEAFDRTTESPDLVAWQNDWIINNPTVWLEWVTLKGIAADQVTADYVKKNIENLYPFPKTFRGFHYENTNRIQVNPDTTFLTFYQNDPYGNKTDTVGYGYYVLGHEMTHLALATKGVPEILHHCIYVTSVDNQPSLMKRMAEFLAAKSIASSIVEFYGLGQEVSLDPCSALTAEQREEAVHYAHKLAPGGSFAAKALIASSQK